MDKRQVIERIRHGLIVSCQALEGEPLYRPEGGVMPLMAEAARRAGAVGIRANGVQDIRDIMARVDLPLIGIIKKNYPGSEAYITPTMDEVDQLVAAGCTIIALDCTRQSHPGGLTSRELVRQARACSGRWMRPSAMRGAGTFSTIWRASSKLGPSIVSSPFT